MASRKQSVGRTMVKEQPANAPGNQQFVSVAVLPPRLAPGMAPTHGMGPSGLFGWQESLNYRHNEVLTAEEESGRRRSTWAKAGFTMKRYADNPDKPPFTMKQVPYETWRNHYAKDKEGNYRGLKAPAADCLLMPHDVKKWRLGEPVFVADKWTRGAQILPVYSEVENEGHVPDYEADYNGPPRTDHPEDGRPSEEGPLEDGERAAVDHPVMTTEEDELATRLEREDSRFGLSPVVTAASSGPKRASASTMGSMDLNKARSGSGEAPKPSNATEDIGTTITQGANGKYQVLIDGKTPEQVIADAKAKGKPKMTWKQRLSKATEQLAGA